MGKKTVKDYKNRVYSEQLEHVWGRFVECDEQLDEEGSHSDAKQRVLDSEEAEL